ncbi:MAG: hypothetical protein PF517_02325 [Salinivirgaceae bacterium]|jgi:membrane-associated HD superfamily phosphohydrolase|nr:hypothetical protein [Salinivirgaceae bacterium]
MPFFHFALTNPLGLIILVLILSIFGYGLYLLFRLYISKSKNVKKTHIDLMLVFGVIAIVYGFLFQIIGMVQALEAVIEAADISPQLVMEGLKDSFIVPIIGMILFIFSVIFWYVSKIKWEINSKI